MRAPLLLAFLAFLAVAASAAAADAPLAARVNGHPVTQQELDRFIAPDLYRVAESTYQTRLQGLQRFVIPQLIEDEAKARGLTAAELERQEVAAKVPDPGEGEVAVVAAMYKDKLPADPAKAKAAVIASIRQQKELARRTTWTNELWQKAKVEVLMDPPRAGIPLSPTDPSRGPADAPVTIVAFGDFECTECAAFELTVAGLQNDNPGKIRLVSRQMPLSVHEHSREAAEMALCAKDQGRYWELHDWLFGNQNALAPEKILAAAPSLGIDPDVLKGCFDAKAHAAEIEADLGIMSQLGVHTTPTVLVNGRLLVGDVAITTLKSVVEDELRRAAVAGVTKR